MSSVIQALTGGSKTKQQQSSKPVDLTRPEFQQLGQTQAAGLTNFIQNQPSFQGQLPGVSQNELTALGAVAGAAYNPNREDLLNKTLQGYFLPGQAGGNPFLQSAIEAAQRPTRDALNDTLSRNLPGVFTAAGQQIGGGLRSPNQNLDPGSTAFDMAAARAFEGGSRALGDIATNLSFQGYNSERERQQGAISLQQQDIASLIQNAQAQALPRLIEKEGVEFASKTFNEKIAALLQAFQLAAQSPISVIGNQSQGTSNTTQYTGALNTFIKPSPIPT